MIKRCGLTLALMTLFVFAVPLSRAQDAPAPKVLHYSFRVAETGFDPAFAEQSPGLTLHFLMLERLHAEGAREFDFGHAHGYKDRFEPETRALVDMRCFRWAWLGKWEDGAIHLETWSRARKAERTARQSRGATEHSAP